MKDIIVFKHTDELWCDSFYLKYTNEMLVEVSFSQLDPDEFTEMTQWSVFVSGTDDLVLGRIFSNENEALTCFMEIIGQESVTFEHIKMLGLIDI